jgi:hypothetical protein
MAGCEIGRSATKEGEIMNLKSRLRKIEKLVGATDDLSFLNYFKELLTLMDGRSRGLPSEEKADPEFEATCEGLFQKYANQPSEVGRKKFNKECLEAAKSLCSSDR